MASKLQISIPTPCHEKWQDMARADKGRFCASCQKNVVDFTGATDKEIAGALKTGNLCGRFLATQLERDLLIPKEKNTFWAAAGTAAITLLTIGNNTLFAQIPAITEQSEKKTNDIKVQKAVKQTITGTVTDDQSYALAGANITVIGYLTTTTTIDGKFSIDAYQGDTIAVTHIGYIDYAFTVQEYQSYYDIVTTQDYSEEELFIVAGAAMVRRTFFGRVFHSIVNIFR
jgi:hypothetical protein